MTKVIGLTGGIGSGKTTVAKLFEDGGISVYYADDRAKAVSASAEIEQKIRGEFGDEIISDSQIDRKKLASIVFNDPEKLAKINAIVHPAVREDFNTWLAQKKTEDFVIREAAILFETGADKGCDKVIAVTAPEEIRIQRVMQRSNINRVEVLARIANQWPEGRKVALSDFVIENIEMDATIRQVRKILKTLKNLQ